MAAVSEMPASRRLAFCTVCLHCRILVLREPIELALEPFQLHRADGVDGAGPQP